MIKKMISSRRALVPQKQSLRQKPPRRLFPIVVASSARIPKIAELAGGRLATVGLMGTSLIGNATGTSVMQQFRAEEPLILAFVVGAIVTTILTYKPNAAEVERDPGRFAMVVMSILILFDPCL
jgi:hypothetical protein